MMAAMCSGSPQISSRRTLLRQKGVQRQQRRYFSEERETSPSCIPAASPAGRLHCGVTGVSFFWKGIRKKSAHSTDQSEKPYPTAKSRIRVHPSIQKKDEQIIQRLLYLHARQHRQAQLFSFPYQYPYSLDFTRIISSNAVSVLIISGSVTLFGIPVFKYVSSP